MSIVKFTIIINMLLAALYIRSVCIHYVNNYIAFP